MFDHLALAVKGLGIKNRDVMFLRPSQKNGKRKTSRKMATAMDKTYASVQIVAGQLTKITPKSAYLFTYVKNIY